jgi:hypothetical protein
MPFISREGITDQSLSPMSLHSDSKEGAAAKNNSYGLCLKTFQTYRALHNHKKDNLLNPLKHKSKSKKIL